MTDTTIPATATTTDLTTLRTPKTGKTVNDFEIPEKFLKEEADLVALVIQSESMNDGERQYWFNLSEIMNAEQIDKLRDILTREREKLNEIEKKYGPMKPTLTPEEIAERNAQIQQERSQQQAELKAREAAAEKNHDDEAILSELDSL